MMIIQTTMMFIAEPRATRQSRKVGCMEAHHEAWLTAHPERTAAWLKRMLREGFDVHHMDGDHVNNDPLNLVLIESRDHLMLHAGARMRLGRVQAKRAPKAKVKAVQSQKKPSEAPLRPSVDHGEAAYRLSLSGAIWIAIGRQFGLSRYGARYAAHQYAKANKLAWPPPMIAQ